MGVLLISCLSLLVSRVHLMNPVCSRVKIGVIMYAICCLITALMGYTQMYQKGSDISLTKVISQADPYRHSFIFIIFVVTAGFLSHSVEQVWRFASNMSNNSGLNNCWTNIPFLTCISLKLKLSWTDTIVNFLSNRGLFKSKITYCMYFLLLNSSVCTEYFWPSCL